MRQSANQAYVETTAWNTNIEAGATLEGRYKGQEIFIGKFGETTKYIIEGKDGIMYGVYDSASLNRQFKVVPEGSYVWITFKGIETSKNGRPVKVYEVEYDTEA